MNPNCYSPQVRKPVSEAARQAQYYKRIYGVPEHSTKAQEDERRGRK